MSNRIPSGEQIDTIDRFDVFEQQTFDLNRLDFFVNSLGVDFTHYRAMPSPIGQKDRGDYRRNDGVDTITSNGMLYKCAGTFTATITDNSRDQKNSDGGLLDPSTSRLVMPRFYNKVGQDDGKRIYLMPEDRVYISDPNADVKVANYHKMDYQPNIDNVAMFPIICMEQNIVDSRNVEFVENIDFIITTDGNIRWLPTGNNPGIDPDTGKGRIYSVRYLYNAFWYIISTPKELRITNVTTNGVRSPQRMPYYAVIMREYMFHNQNKGDKLNQLVPKDPKRTESGVIDSITPDRYSIPVDMANLILGKKETT